MATEVVVFCEKCHRPFDAVKSNRVPEVCDSCQRERQRKYLKRRRRARQAA